MDNPQALAWEATQQLCGNMELETAMTGFFRCLRTGLPLTHILLGRFDGAEQRVFLISRTDKSGTVRDFHTYPLSTEQRELARALRFFDPAWARDQLIVSRDEPVAALYRYEGLPVGYPFYVHRLATEHSLYGGATFLFEEGSVVTENMIAVLQGIEAPLSIFISAWFQYWNLQQLKEQIYRENRKLRQKLSGLDEVRVIGAGGGLKSVMEQLRRVAPWDVSVLLRGETGTGKEVAAKALHHMSPYAKGPFVAVNCGALPPSLLDSELFGYAKGAFTGAVESRKGYFERAEGGTLFLDEVAELPLDAQARLLRVIQERVVQRVGDSRPLPVRFRLAAATHRDLETMVAEGRFREDLYYRLNVVSLTIPPLRERREDIPLLLHHFLEQEANRFGILTPRVPDEELSHLLAYDWPGNVRELQNAVAEALALSARGPLRFRPRGVGEAGRERAVPAADSLFQSGEKSGTAPAAVAPYDVMMRDYLSRALARCQGKIRGPGGAAELVGLNYSTLRMKLKKYGVTHGRKRACGPE